MNREDIIRMAREAGLHIATDVNWMPVIGLEYAVKFAALVASAERERLTDAAMKAAEKAVDVAIALEREACAKLCEEYAIGLERNYSEIIADKIRARGQA